MLNIAFAQLLVIPNLAKNRVIWFIAWLGYTLALYFFPIIWFLPPLVGSLILLIGLGKNFVHLFRFAHIPLKDVAKDALRGFLTAPSSGPISTCSSWPPPVRLTSWPFT